MDYRGDDDGFEAHLAALGFGNRASTGSNANRSSLRMSAGRSSSGRVSTSSRVRSDSDIARELQEKLGQPGGDVRPEDEELARDLHNQLNEPNLPGVARISTPANEAEDASLAQAIIAAERAAILDHQAHVVAVLENDNGDYHRPKNYYPYFCYGVLIFTSLMMLVEIWVNDWEFESLSVNPTIGPSVETLEKLGAKSTELILQGDFYRLFTPMVLHAGLVHLLFNMIGLLNVGFPAEREFGHWKIAVIYISSGVFGVLLSAIFVPQQIGVGASGAIFGLFGSAWSDLIHNWSLYREQAHCVLVQLLVATVINLMLGLLPFLDNFAHVGGFLCGLTLGFTLLVQNTYDVWGFRKARKTYQLVIQAASITAIPIFFVVLMLVLYLQVDVAKSCTWCSYVSCVPLPPGVPDEEKWWDCSPCSMSDISVFNASTEEGSYSVSCPNGETVFVPFGADPDLTIPALIENERLVINVCKRFCDL